MTEHICTFEGRRDELIVAYVYDELAAADRAAFEPHLSACAVCREELAAFGTVRAELSQWTPPEPRRALTPPVAPARRWQVLQDLPAWARAAAAVLVGAIALGAANVQIAYGESGLVVTSGWMRASSSPASEAAPAASPALAQEIAALRDELRREIVAQVAATASAGAAAAPVSTAEPADVLRDVRAMVADSEARQQRELALRVAELQRSAEAQRQGDLVRIERALGIIQNQSGRAVLEQRQMINSLALRVGQRQ